MKLADEARLAQRLEDAVSLYGEALKLRPKWSEGWWYVGAIFYQKDMYPQARDAFLNLAALEPARGPAWAMLGLCQFQTGEFEKSVMALQRARAQGVNDESELASVVRYHTALLYLHFELFETAYEVLSEFMRVGNDSPKIIEAFGLTLLRLPYLPKEVPAAQR